MDSNKIKNLATGVRAALRAEASSRLDAVLAPGSTERLEHAQQVIMLEQRISEQGREEVVDSAAYTWFNRLCALRFMDARGYTPVPVVTPRAGTTQPAVLADAAQGAFDPELEVPEAARQRIAGVLLGSIPSANPSEDAYEEILAAVCARYAKPMPYLFSEDIASSLLMPRGLLAQGSILTRIVSELDGEACSSVEVLGWLYHFYISERKDEYFSSKKQAAASDIPAATQLFTPEWIVRYLTENSLGRLWMLNNPGSELALSMEYYIAPEGDEPHIEIASAEDIRVLDPACGSGHILVYAFDLLYRMYEEEGWLPEDIPAKILTQNLAGLEIDRRAAEIASFALEMKALERDPRFLDRCIDADIRVLEPVELTPDELLSVPQLAERIGLLEAMAHMDEVGSLYVPDGWDVFTLDNEIARIGDDRSLFSSNLPDKLKAMRDNVEALSKTYHCVVANPPYLLKRNAPQALADYVSEHYQGVDNDTCTCFIEMCRNHLSINGLAALVTMDSWLALSSYTSYRERLTNERAVALFAHLGTSAFPSIGGEVVSVVAAVFGKGNQYTELRAIDLTNQRSSEEKRACLLLAIKSNNLSSFDVDDFSLISSSPYTGAFLNKSAIEALRTAEPLGRNMEIKQGIKTGNNDIFLRLWFEVSECAESMWGGKKWFPITKGGLFRKWYGNNEYVVNWENDGEAIRNFRDENGKLRSRPQNLQYMFREGLTYTNVSDALSVRYCPEGFAFDATGSMMFCRSRKLLLERLGFLLSSTAGLFAHILSPKMTVEVGQMNMLPLRPLTEGGITNLVERNIHICRTDWDSFETSWDFASHPLARTSRISDAYALWDAECRERFEALRANEEELNRIFARIYGMEGEVPIEVPEDKVSVRLAERARDARSLISYGVGCMLGRYSTYEPGLILADQGQTLEDFREKAPQASFLPDADNVLPVLADEWFEDDIVAGFKSWLADTYGAENLDENVAWLEGSIGTDLRSYFCKDFYADHVKVYQKRPIYWMFSSPKGAFRCLVYMHRYEPGTVGTILTGYLRPLEDKLRSRIQALSGSSGARDVREADRLRAQLAELEAWERDIVYPLAHERVSIDLDDGVKANYNRFPHALAKVQGLSEWR